MSVTGADQWTEQWQHEDAPRRDEADRWAVYAVPPRQGLRGSTEAHRRVCETSEDGLVQAIRTMLAEDEIPRGWRVGVLDRLTRRWLIDPFA